MTDIARLQLDVDTRKLKDGERELDHFGNQAKRTAGDVDKASAGIVGSFKAIGGALVAAQVGMALVDFGRKSVQAAIDAQEMGSAFRVVFGDMADDVEKWAEQTGNALGRSTQEIQRGALAFQELFGKALDPEQATEMSKRFAVLTQDLASFKNLSNEVAQQKLFSGLTGEAEPLRAVGVFLSETAVEAKAVELGLKGVNNELTDQEKIVARAAIIQEQLAQASGDVERTSGSTANQIKTYNAAVEELQVAIGQRLLPQLTPLVTVTAELVTMMANAAQSINVTSQATANFVEGLRVVGGLVARAASTMGGFASAIGLTGERLDWLYKKAQFLINPLSTVIRLIERVGAAQRAQQGASGLINGSFSTDFIAGELAAMGKGVTAINAPSALPAMATNLDRVGASAGRAASAAKVARDEFADMMEALYPENTTRRQMEQLAFIDRNASRFSNPVEARRRALGIDGEAPVSSDLLNQGPLAEARKVMNASGDINKSLEELQGKSKTQTVAIAESFAQMAQKITSSLQGLANSIRSGDFLGILGGVLDIFTQLGSAGVFGSGLAGRLNATPSNRSMGGPVYAGSPYIVGENGPELFTPPGSGKIVANDNIRSPEKVIVINNNPMADVYVDGRIIQSAPVVANAGALQAQAQMSRSNRRRVR